MTMIPSQKAFLEILRELDRPTVLDFGSKTGDFWDDVEEHADVYGCDLTLHPRMEERVKRTPDRFRVSHNPQEIPYEDSKFDLVFANSVFEHVDPLASIVRECARVLKPGGRLIAVFPTKSVIREPHVKVPFVSQMAPGSIRQAWIRACYGLGFGAAYVARRGGVNAASALAEKYLSEATFYRPYAEHLRLLRRYFSNVDDRTSMLIRARGVRCMPGLSFLASRFYAVCFDARK